MPLERIALWLVVAAALAWVAAALAGALSAGPAGLFVLLPLGLAGYLLWRVIAERRSNAEDDRYDRIEK